FQKAAAFIHEFLLKLSEDVECAEVRDTLNLALLHMQKYYRLIQNRSQEKCANTLSLTTRGLSPMTPFVDAPDKFIWRWLNLDNAKLPSSMGLGDSLSLVVLPPIITAAKAGDVELASELIHQDPGCADCVDGLGRTACMYAVHFFQHDVLRFLLEHRSDINAQAHDGSTAMHRACHDGNHLALQLLVDCGGDFTISDVQGRAPIHWAVTTRSTDCLQVLLQNRVFAGTRDKDGLTPSMWACRMDNIRHFELLCQAENNHVEEPDGIERDGNGRTWMHWSVRRTQPLECLQTLLTPDSAAIKDDEGKTVLLVAAEMGSLPACRLIVEIAGSRCIGDQDHQGRSALHLATMGGHGDVVNFLLEKHADVNVVDSFNATAWDYARIRKLHYCQLIIMSHQRQRMSSNPNSPLPNGFGLLMREDSAGMHDDFSRMSFRTRSNQSTPITPPHPPKRPRSSRMLARRSNSLTSADRERAREREREWNSRMHQSEERAASSGGGKKERLSVMVNTSNKRMSAGDIYMNGREDTMMTESSRPMFEDENDEISVGGMDVSDIEDEGDQGSVQGPSRGPSEQAHPTPRPRPPPRGRPQHLMGVPSPPAYPPNSGVQMQGFFNNVNNMNITQMNNQNNNISQQQQQQQQHHQHHHQQQQQQQQRQQQNKQNLQVQQQMEYEDAGSGPSPRHIANLNMNNNNQRQLDQQQQQQHRPQARVPPTPVYRPQRGGNVGPAASAVPSPPSSTPQRPHMLRQQQVLPSPPAASPPAAAPRELTPPTVRDPSPPSQGSEQQHSSRSQGERPSSGGNQPPGVLEGRRIPPPALTPLQNAPKPPNLDMFDRVDKKKKKKKKDRDRKESKSPPPKPENPSDIPPPRGFAAPLHPHMQQGQGGQSSRISSAVPPAPRYSKGTPQVSDSRYVDENVEEEEGPPSISGFAVQIRDGATKSARPGHRGSHGGSSGGGGGGGLVGASLEEEGEGMDTTLGHSQGEGIMQDPIEEVDEAEDVGPLIPPPPSFRGAVSRGGAKQLAQSVPQDNRSSSRMAPTSAKPPLPKSRGSVTSASPRHNPRPPGKSASHGRKSRPPTSKSSQGL
ncbi:ankyrin repeat domain-containing protein 55, partial [Plakobranchus ocellatus]